MGICSIHSFPTSYASVLYERASCGHVATVVAVGATLQVKAHYMSRLTRFDGTYLEIDPQGILDNLVKSVLWCSSIVV